MTPNELLLWLSARKEGSWPQFRAAVEMLDLADADDEQETPLPLHQRVRLNLERLGHVEFDAGECEDGWRVVPPALALSQHENRVTGVLCGARTPKLMERVEQAAGELSFERGSDTDCPDIIRVHAPESEDLIEFAKREGLLSQVDTPTSLLSRIPPVDAFKGWHREPLPTAGRDWDVRQFVIQRKVMKWQPITLREANSSEAQGLFCFTRFQMPQYFLREGQETIKLPGAVGKYMVLSQHQRRVLRYNRKERSLTLPAIFRPPLLTERALILCSGFPPSLSVFYGRPKLTYRDIPEEVAGMTAEVLRQDLL
jgi:hypothetical protein